MLHHKKIKWLGVAIVCGLGLSLSAFAGSYFDRNANVSVLNQKQIAAHLGWIPVPTDRCGGYYLDPALPASALRVDNSIEINGDQLLFNRTGTSVGKGRVTISRHLQQITAEHAWLFRDPHTKKLSAIQLKDHVILQEPNDAVVADSGYVNLVTREETLTHLFYRTSVFAQHDASGSLPMTDYTHPRKIQGLTAFGQADTFVRTVADVDEFENVSYSTCPPLTHTWHLRASHLQLNKVTGRGVAKSARLYVHGVPIFYFPWINFPIDSRRQTGFLMPTVGSSSRSGFKLTTPFYWNMAPDHDLTLTPELMVKRGLQLGTKFRYLTQRSVGFFNVSVLPHDRVFSQYQKTTTQKYAGTTDPVLQAELHRLNQASTTRQAINIVNNTQFNSHWRAQVDYSRVSDDYYLRDFSSSLNQTTDNQLLQQGQIQYQNNQWRFTTNVQAYQTLHPVDSAAVQNQYIRLPQLTLNGTLPRVHASSFNFLLSSDVTHFVITHTPGDATVHPEGLRTHVQPGIERPFLTTWSYFTPRLQLALTQYDVSHQAPHASQIDRALPIFDLHSGLYFDRDFSAGNQDWQQTLEPQIYYTYVPYHDQSRIPLFDTAANTLNYDQLFSYTRFSGIDRISDANQISYGMVTRFLHADTGSEVFRAGIGQIFYFHPRSVTLTGEPTAEDRYNKSPIAGQLAWQMNPDWNLHLDSIWSVQNNGFNNQNITLSYLTDTRKVFNLSYGFVREGDVLPTDSVNSSARNLSQTDVSFAWPVVAGWHVVGRWTQNWNHHHFQNLLYGLQYDTCCWAIRFVAARAFTGLSEHNTFQYDTGVFVQLALKGLGNFGDDPSQLLNASVANYQSNFGQTI